MRLILGKIDISIPFEVGVKKGDSVALVLFLFIMMTFLETLEEEWVNFFYKLLNSDKKAIQPNLQEE